MNTEEFKKYLAGEAQDKGVSSEGDKSVEELQSDLAKHKKHCVAKPGNCPKEKELRSAIEEKEAPKDDADKKVSEAEGNGVEDDDFESILADKFKAAAEECTDRMAKSQLRCGKDLIQLFQENDDGSLDIEIAVKNPAPNGIDYELGTNRGYRDVWEDEAVLADYKREFSDIVDDLLEERGYHGDELYDFGDWDVDPGDEETLVYSVHAEPDKDDDDDNVSSAGESGVIEESDTGAFIKDGQYTDFGRQYARCSTELPPGHFAAVKVGDKRIVAGESANRMASILGIRMVNDGVPMLSFKDSDYEAVNSKLEEKGCKLADVHEDKNFGNRLAVHHLGSIGGSASAAQDAGVSSSKRMSKARKYLDAVAEDWSKVHADGSPCKAKTPESCPFNQKAEKGDSDVSSDKGKEGEEKLPETKAEFNAYFVEQHPDLVKDLYDTGHMDSVSEAVAEKYAREVYKDPWGHFGDNSYNDFLESSAKWLCQEQIEADKENRSRKGKPALNEYD